MTEPIKHQPRADRSSGSSQDEEGLEMRNPVTLRFQWILPILAIVAGLMMPAAASAQTSCPPTINSTQGLTPNGACIEIFSSFVILDGGKKNITGPSVTKPTGVGIWVHHK